MALSKLYIQPEVSSYSVQEAATTVVYDLNGGFGRYRRDLISARPTVSCQWSLDEVGYQYFTAFYSSVISNGADPFYIDLIYDGGSLTQYQASFLPETISLSQHAYNQYQIQAELEIVPSAVNASADNALISSYGTEAKLELLPVQQVYSIKYGVESIATRLNGGASKFGALQKNNSATISVNWVLNANDFAYFRAYYRTAIAQGSESFLIDLILTNSTVSEHTARFVPDSLSIGVRGDGYFVVGASLEVQPNARDDDYDASLIMLVGEYGSPLLAREIINELETFANVTLPDNL